MTTICIFEDDGYSRLYPLTYTRPVYELLCGMMTLRERIIRTYSDCTVAFHCRTHLAGMVESVFPGVPVNTIPCDDCLFINGRVLSGAELSDRAGVYRGRCVHHPRGKTGLSKRPPIDHGRGYGLDIDHLLVHHTVSAFPGPGPQPAQRPAARLRRGCPVSGLDGCRVKRQAQYGNPEKCQGYSARRPDGADSVLAG